MSELRGDIRLLSFSLLSLFLSLSFFATLPLIRREESTGGEHEASVKRIKREREIGRDRESDIVPKQGESEDFVEDLEPRGSLRELKSCRNVEIE